VIPLQIRGQIVNLAGSDDRRTGTDARKMRLHRLAANLHIIDERLPAHQHVEVDVSDSELVAKTPLAVAQLAIEVLTVLRHVRDAPLTDAGSSGLVRRERRRHHQRPPSAMQCVRSPHNPAVDVRATRVTERRNQASSGKTIGDVQQDRTRLVDRDIAIAQRWHTLEGIGFSKRWVGVTLAWMHVDYFVGCARLFQSSTRRKRRGTSDLIEVNHRPGRYQNPPSTFARLLEPHRRRTILTMEALRQLPGVDQILTEPMLGPMIDELGTTGVTALVRIAIEQRRAALLHGAPPAADRAGETVLIIELARSLDQPPLRSVINATGVIVHTNLGRAPLAAEAVAAVAGTAGGYADLELDLTTGQRGSRQSHVGPTIARLVGAEAGLAVNNAAGALVLTLAALARGREVIVSRGQMIEIGDGFRLPDIMEQAGARLVEVGATNRTRLGDYANAIGPNTAMLLRAHPSNFRVVGFVEEVATRDLAELGHERGIAVVDDIGSGLLTPDPDLPGEPDAVGAITAGADVILFSGDKLLGGPQAGLIAGRADLIHTISRHPLARALRIDRLSLAALQATLRLHTDPERARQAVPVRRLISMPLADVRRRAEALAAATDGAVVDTAARIGGGALPTVDLASAACAIPDHDGSLHEALRTGNPAILGRLEDGLLLLDCRTLLSDDDVAVIAERVLACR